MPYPTIASLPAAVRAKYSVAGQRAFLQAFNECVYRDGKSEAEAMKMAHAAARRVSSAKAPSKPKKKTNAAKAFTTKKASRMAGIAGPPKQGPIAAAMMTY